MCVGVSCFTSRSRAAGQQAKNRGRFILSVDKGQGGITHGGATANDHDRLIFEEKTVAGGAAAREGGSRAMS